MVGAATALGLAKLGLSITLIENRRQEHYDPEQALDVRVSAISMASVSLLQSLGAMEAILAMRHIAYSGLETWEMEGAATCFHASQVGLDKLGYILENRVIQLGLWQQMAQYPNLHVYCPAAVTSYHQQAQGVSVVLENGTHLQARLLIGCDGANSQVRQWAGIGVSGWDYRQSAMLINIATADDLPAVTWQQFTPDGPRSLLPLPDKHASLVWYDKPQRIGQLMQLNNVALMAEIKRHFPNRLATEFIIEAKGSFPLTRRHASRYYQDNVVILGDAAHTINPLAGQGVNLGFKDVAALIDVIATAKQAGQDWASNATLACYQSQRYRDNLLMMTTMDAFYAGFSNRILPLKLLRNAALKLADNSGPIKDWVLKYALGLH
ncbi:FAD-dependent monooxygenase [Shewanella sp. NIFS-20-20]|nr:FAD-dependent monooxygenase [Shewanella sp. NIFS-20-20]